MKDIFAKKTAMLFAMGCSLALLGTGCINESLDACPSHKLTVTVLNEVEDDVTEASDQWIEEVTVYVFDNDLHHLSTHHLTQADVMARRKIDLPYPEGTKLRVVAWGNANVGKVNISEGELIEQLQVSLKTEVDVAELPSRLFFGKDQLQTNSALTAEEIVVDTVPIRLKVGELRIFSKNIPEPFLATLKSGESSELQVTRTLGKWDHEGELVGDSVLYMPEPTQGVIDGREELDTDFQMYAPGQGMGVRLAIPGQEPLNEIRDLETGLPLSVTPWLQTQARFIWGEDGTYLGMRISVRPWKAVPDPIEW